MMHSLRICEREMLKIKLSHVYVLSYYSYYSYNQFAADFIIFSASYNYRCYVNTFEAEHWFQLGILFYHYYKEYF